MCNKVATWTTKERSEFIQTILIVAVWRCSTEIKLYNITKFEYGYIFSQWSRYTAYWKNKQNDIVLGVTEEWWVYKDLWLCKKRVRKKKEQVLSARNNQDGFKSACHHSSVAPFSCSIIIFSLLIYKRMVEKKKKLCWI